VIVYAGTGTLDNQTGSAMAGSGEFRISQTVTIGDVDAQFLKIRSRGISDGNGPTFTGTISLRDSDFDCTWTEFTGGVKDFDDCRVRFNVCHWDGQIIMRSGGIIFSNTCNSFVSPATASDVNNPLTLVDDATFYDEGGLNINGLGGRDNANHGTKSQTVTANTTEIDFNMQDGRWKTTELTSTASYTGCTLAITSDDRTGVRANEGDRWTIHFVSGSGDIEIVESTTAEIVGGSLTLGLGSGEYWGITFQHRSDDKWWEIGRTPAVP
jgi:hypothetical protein